MIGVTGSPADLEVAAEFFELFKTPWERAVPSRRYSAVLSADGCTENLDAELLLLYGSAPLALDRHAGVSVQPVVGPTTVAWAESTFPVYGCLSVFDCGVEPGTLTSGSRAVEYRQQFGRQVVRRIGYDLFDEVRLLLTQGQPSSNALTPTLELHIALLRHLLVKSGVSFAEIPPRPAGYDFICCLTHDLDFFGLRRHGFDRTIGGFIARASVGTLVDLARRRRTLGEAARNWFALASLPLVFLGLIRDPWRPFADYARVEDGRRSTFFLVPFKGRSGVAPDGTIDSRRAVAYDVSEIGEEAKQAAARGSELAVHGIDAWRDSGAGRAEMSRLMSVTGQKTVGIRMHWLYFSGDSPKRLEQAGFDYDSTWGYNDAVGFRAGTSQVFRLTGTEKLLELPLLIMDSALLFPGRMGLCPEGAVDRCGRIVADVRRFGGTLVINWHDRSLAPERLWGRSYETLLNDVETGNHAWFATAVEAVDWYRWRRSIRFTKDSGAGQLTVMAPAANAVLPAGTIAIHRPGVAIESRRVDAQTAQTLSV
jgi:hypothetical protein